MAEDSSGTVPGIATQKDLNALEVRLNLRLDKLFGANTGRLREFVEISDRFDGTEPAGFWDQMRAEGLRIVSDALTADQRLLAQRRLDTALEIQQLQSDKARNEDRLDELEEAEKLRKASIWKVVKIGLTALVTAVIGALSAWFGSSER